MNGASGTCGRPEDRVIPVMTALSVLVHAAGIALAVWIAQREPPKITPVQKPVTAKLVRLGKPRDKRLLPRLGSIVVFIDEIHTLIGAGATEDGPQDAANELKSAMARGEFPCIGATTDAEFKKYIEKDSAIQRRFTPVRVEEPSVEDTVAILQGIVGHYSLHHGVGP